MEEHFDTVVVGSGFGASVFACRLAQAGRRVCVLERGAPYPPGSFPRSPHGLAGNVWSPNTGQYGLFDIWAFRGLESIVSAGLGGGSLIYANVLLRKDPAWFVDDDPAGGGRPWPVSYEDLEDHYRAAEEMLGAQRYPFEVEPYASTPKTVALKEAAATLGLEWMLPKLAVTFANEGRPPVPGEPIAGGEDNLHGRSRSTCRLCGECDTGCNYGAKNTLDYTYLSQAVAHGAEIRTLSEVRRIEPDSTGGYRITYLAHVHDRVEALPGSSPEQITVTADRLVVGAGTFGSTYLLLRNRSAFPRLSPALGTRFSGNGDLLTFLHHARRTIDGKSVPRRLDPDFGPVITSAIRLPDTLDGGGPVGRGFYVEDGGNPTFLGWLAEASGIADVSVRVAAFALRRAWAHLTGRPRSNLSGDVSSLLHDGVISSTALPMLAMGRDIPDGVLRLRHGGLELDWSSGTSAAYFDRVEETVGRIAETLGAALANTPMWLFKRVITVHPLGGCPMGRTESEGVVDRWGEVFGYPGLYVADGSVMPGPVGPNPSLTIAAFAERAAAKITDG